MKNKTSFHKFMDATSGVKVEMALNDEIKALWRKTVDQVWEIGGNINYNQSKNEKEMQRLKTFSTKEIIKKLDDYEEGAKKLGLPISAELQQIKAKAINLEKNAEKAFAEAFNNSTAIGTAIGKFMDNSI